MKYNAELDKPVDASGAELHPSFKTSASTFSGGKTIVIGGFFVETKEVIAALWRRKRRSVT